MDNNKIIYHNYKVRNVLLLNEKYITASVVQNFYNNLYSYVLITITLEMIISPFKKNQLLLIEDPTIGYFKTKTRTVLWRINFTENDSNEKRGLIILVLKRDEAN